MAMLANGDDEIITGINVTPLVDVVLVLLVILMVTAGYVVARALPLELPRAATGETVPRTLTISIARDGALFLDGAAIARADLGARVRRVAGAAPDARAVIAADGRTPHADVVRVIDVLRQASLTRFSLNVDPEELARLAARHPGSSGAAPSGVEPPRCWCSAWARTRRSSSGRAAPARRGGRRQW